MSTQPENLSAYLDGELTAAEIAALEAELASDPGLRAELEALEGAVDFVRSHGPLQAPEGFKAAVLAEIAREPAPSGSGLVWLRRPLGVPLEALALAAAAVFVLVFALDRGGDETAADRAVEAPAEKTAAGWGAEQTTAEEGEEDADGLAQLDLPAKGEASAKSEAPSKLAPRARPKPKPSPQPAPVLTTKEVEAIGGQGTTEPEAAPAGEYGSGMTIVPFSYTLSTEDANVLKQLDVLARRYGGRLETSGGQAYSVHTMAPGTEKVFVRLPNTQMSNFGAELRKLGQVHLADANDMVASSEVTLEIRVDYEPGTTGYESSSYDKKK